VVERELLGKAFMPGGTLGHYKQGKREYDIFIARAASPTAAANLLVDWRNALKSPKFVAGYGGYLGDDAGSPVFVFTKGDWIAGIRGLNEKDADLPARTVAGRL
jgi:hypothetical protein